MNFIKLVRRMRAIGTLLIEAAGVIMLVVQALLANDGFKQAAGDVWSRMQPQ
jgi:hypothetical protein